MTSIPTRSSSFSSTNKMHPLAAAIAAALVVCAVVIPARGSAVALAGADSATLDAVVLGMWIFKAMLLVHAGLLFAAARIRPQGSATPLLASSAAASDRIPNVAWMITGLLAMAAALRLYGLNQGLWFDEITALVNYGRAPTRVILTTFDSQNQHMLYSLLAHGALETFGDSAWAMRLPAVLFGVASLWATYWFGIRVTSRREALLATALLTFSYHHVWFSQNARGYTGLLFFTLVSSALFIDLLRRREANGWGLAVAYAIASALGVYTHTSAVLVTIAHFLVWCVAILWGRVRGERLGWASWLPLGGFILAGTLTIQLYAPVLTQFLSTATAPTMSGVDTEWKNPIWFAAEAIRGLASGIPGGLAVVAAAAAVGVAGLVSYVRRGLALAAIMLLPAFLTVVAMLATSHNLWPRLFFFCAGFAVLIGVRGVMVAAAAFAGRLGPALATAGLLLVAIASGFTVPRAWAPKQDYASAREYIESHRAASDAVVAVDMTRFPYENYYHAGWLGADNEAELASIEAGHPRTWVVYTMPARLSQIAPGLWGRLEQDYTRAASFGGTVGGGAIVVMVRQ